MKSESREDQVREILTKAAAMLPGYLPVHDERSTATLSPLVGTWSEFHMFFNESEQELAWDALEALGRKYKAHAEFWLLLGEAAELMRLEEQATRARSAAIE